MNQAILTRVNCIGITYVVGEIRDYHYEEIIEKILGVPESEVEGIDDRGNTVIRGVKGLRGVKGQFFIFVLTDSIII